jgi:hypothetical protein
VASSLVGRGYFYRDIYYVYARVLACSFAWWLVGTSTMLYHYWLEWSLCSGQDAPDDYHSLLSFNPPPFWEYSVIVCTKCLLWTQRVFRYINECRLFEEQTSKWTLGYVSSICWLLVLCQACIAFSTYVVSSISKYIYTSILKSSSIFQLSLVILIIYFIYLATYWATYITVICPFSPRNVVSNYLRERHPWIAL